MSSNAETPKEIIIKKWNRVEVDEKRNVVNAFYSEGNLVKYYAIIDKNLRVAWKIPLGSELTTAELLAAIVELEILAQKHLA